VLEKICSSERYLINTLFSTYKQNLNFNRVPEDKGSSDDNTTRLSRMEAANFVPQEETSGNCDTISLKRSFRKRGIIFIMIFYKIFNFMLSGCECFEGDEESGAGNVEKRAHGRGEKSKGSCGGERTAREFGGIREVRLLNNFSFSIYD
jgi:hypothetical protein